MIFERISGSLVRFVFILAGAAGLAVFFLPVLTGRILNIGNTTGMAVSACLLFYGSFRETADRRIGLMLEAGGAARMAVLAAGALLCLTALTAAVLTFFMIRAAMKRPSPDAVVIVLGCQVRGTRPSLMLESRIDAAASYLKEHPDALCVVSGGMGEGEDISEAECMYRSLTGQGIKTRRILLEDRSVSTRENLLFSRRILEKAGFAGPGEAAIVTNEFHALRAQLIARRLGFHCGSVPAKTPWWLLPTFYVRELYGILYQFFF